MNIALDGDFMARRQLLYLSCLLPIIAVSWWAVLAFEILQIASLGYVIAVSSEEYCDVPLKELGHCRHPKISDHCFFSDLSSYGLWEQYRVWSSPANNYGPLRERKGTSISEKKCEDFPPSLVFFYSFLETSWSFEVMSAETRYGVPVLLSWSRFGVSASSQFWFDPPNCWSLFYFFCLKGFFGLACSFFRSPISRGRDFEIEIPMQERWDNKIKLNFLSFFVIENFWRSGASPLSSNMCQRWQNRVASASASQLRSIPCINYSEGSLPEERTQVLKFFGLSEAEGTTSLFKSIWGRAICLRSSPLLFPSRLYHKLDAGFFFWSEGFFI